MVEQTMEPKSTKTAAFTALTRSGVTVWGYRSGVDPTGIKEHVASKSQQTMKGDLFDLQGRRVTKVTGKGFYIENGRKRVIK